jgi:hypothetical protein
MDFSHLPHNVEAPTIFLSQLKSSNCLGLGDRCRYFGKGLSVVSLLASSSTFSLPLIPTWAGIYFTIIFFFVAVASRTILVVILFDLSSSSDLRSTQHAVSEYEIPLCFQFAYVLHRCLVRCHFLFHLLRSTHHVVSDNLFVYLSVGSVLVTVIVYLTEICLQLRWLFPSFPFSNCSSLIP